MEDLDPTTKWCIFARFLRLAHRIINDRMEKYESYIVFISK